MLQKGRPPLHGQVVQETMTFIELRIVDALVLVSRHPTRQLSNRNLELVEVGIAAPGLRYAEQIVEALRRDTKALTQVGIAAVQDGVRVRQGEAAGRGDNSKSYKTERKNVSPMANT